MAEKKAQKKAFSFTLCLFTIVVILLCIILIYKSVQANEELESKEAVLAEYNNAIIEASEKSREMEEEIRYRATDDYIEEAARDIGLIDPNETIITPEE